MFTLLNQSSSARRGRLKTAHGEIETPFFMPIATAGAIKGLVPDEIKKMGGQTILANTYHLHLRPGEEIVEKAGGLHRLMGWDGAILTDSGGYQVFSLSAIRKLKEGGVEFRSHLDGSPIFLTPEKAIEIQLRLGSDIIMCLDECPPHNAKRTYVEKSLELTTRWAERCRKGMINHALTDPTTGGVGPTKGAKPLLFGIVQGGMFTDLREKSAKQLVKIGFDGYAIGGLSVGEPDEMMYEMIDSTAPHLPEKKPRYLMGVGTPQNILEAVERGIDMFDCVLPTRNARHGQLFTSVGVVRIRNERYKTDFTPPDPSCACYTCKHFTKAYLRHLFVAKEPLALRLNTMHNVAFYLNLMKKIRKAIEQNRFDRFKRDFLKRMET